MSISGEEYFKPLLEHIRQQRGVDFASYKPATLRRRMDKRLQELNLTDYGRYLDHLQASPEEIDALLEVVFINVTGFLRDPEAWKVLAEKAIPEIVENAGSEGVRVWCAGVASGQEVYTCAMLLAEAMGVEAFLARAKLFATDLDDGALLQARDALFKPDEVQDVPDALRARYFTKAGDHFQFRQDLRRVVIFGKHDLLEDAPISRVRLLICRNTLMYLGREAQNRVLGRFHFALRPEGFLFLGRAEMLLTRRHLFTPLDVKARIFRKVSDLTFRDRIAVLSQASNDDDEQAVLGEVQLRDLAFDTSVVPEVVIDESGKVAVANRAARLMLGLGHADIGRPFQDLDLSYKPVELRAPIEAARQDQEPREIRNIEWRDGNGGVRYFDIRITALLDNRKGVAVKLSFMDVTRHRELSDELTSSRRELQVAYEELQATNEELETTNEELQSTVEELETTNEELHATNEELETMNEELQATNVEVETVNDELSERSEEIRKVNRYVRSILDSLSSAVFVTDRDLKVRFWNSHAEALWGLRSEEVQGKALLGLEFGLPVQDLKEVLRRCIDGNAGDGRLEMNGHDRLGRPQEHHVRCLPLQDGDGSIDGVITMVESRPA